MSLQNYRKKKLKLVKVETQVQKFNDFKLQLERHNNFIKAKNELESSIAELEKSNKLLAPELSNLLQTLKSSDKLIQENIRLSNVIKEHESSLNLIQSNNKIKEEKNETLKNKLAGVQDRINNLTLQVSEKRKRETYINIKK